MWSAGECAPIFGLFLNGVPIQGDEERWWREIQLAASASAGGRAVNLTTPRNRDSFFQRSGQPGKSLHRDHMITKRFRAATSGSGQPPQNHCTAIVTRLLDVT